MDIRERENSDILADILYVISTECGCEILVTKTCNRGRISYIYLYHGLGEYSILICWRVSTDPFRKRLKCKRANHSVSSASSDRGLTATRLCSIETHAIFSDFHHFQAGSVDFELILVKCRV